MTATVTNSPRTFYPLKLGGGGFITGYDMHTDGTFVCRTDVYGAYIWNASTLKWEQLVTDARMPDSDVHVDFYAGVFEIAIAPSNSSVIYMAYLGYVYKSTNKGQNFVRTGFTKIADMAPNGVSQRLRSKIAIDPLDANVVYFGTTSDGLFRTLDGGTSWSVLTDVPVGTSPGVLGIIINPYEPTVSGRSGTIWASSHGNGFYRSTDGGETWATVVNGPPSSVQSTAVGTDGKIYATGVAGSTLYIFGTSWSNKAITHARVFCDPFDAARVLVCETSGDISQSANYGVTFGSKIGGVNVTRNAAGTGDIPWFNFTSEVFMSTSRMGFHPTIQNKLIFAEGIGVWTAILAPGATSVAWVSQSAGIEELVASDIRATPNGDLILACWDRPIWKITNPNTYQSSHYIPPASTKAAINHCMSLDYATSDPDFMVALLGMQDFDENHTAKSTDGGDIWTQLAALPTESSQYGCGCVAVSTPLNFIIVPTNNQTPQYTLDGGASWNDISLPGKASWSNNHSAYYLRRFIVCADRVTLNKFYYYYPDGSVFVTVDGGVNWTQQIAATGLAASAFNTSLKAVFGKAGHLWFTPGQAGNLSDYLTPTGLFRRSVDDGTAWSTIADVTEVYCFCFGKAAPGAAYPTLYIIGWVNGGYGLYMSTDVTDTPSDPVSWTKIGTWPLGSLDRPMCMDGDKNVFGKVYLGFNGYGFAYTAGSITGTFGLQF